MAEVIQAAMAETQWHIDVYSELIKRSVEQQLSLINEISDKVVKGHFRTELDKLYSRDMVGQLALPLLPGWKKSNNNGGSSTLTSLLLSSL
jgi:hypothetical protein